MYPDDVFERNHACAESAERLHKSAQSASKTKKNKFCCLFFVSCFKGYMFSNEKSNRSTYSLFCDQALTTQVIHKYLHFYIVRLNIIMSPMKEGRLSLLFWAITLIGLPISFPYLIYEFIRTMKEKQKCAALNNKVVMITGASSGLGEALAHIFYRCGCKIILVARRKEELERVKKDLTGINAAITHIPVILPLDLTETESLKDKVIKTINIYNRIDILINNAGISYRGTVSDTDIEVHKKLMLVNYFSQLALNSIVLPFMIKQNYGHIISISSVQGRIAIPYRSAYAASKHALQAWYDSARAELYDKNINFTVVNPGYIKTSLSCNALTGSGQVYGVMDATTENGYEPEYVAECVLRSVLNQEKEITIAPFTAKAAIVLRTLFPSLYFYVMKQRAKKEKN